jgi:hypothetical protein
MPTKKPAGADAKPRAETGPLAEQSFSMLQEEKDFARWLSKDIAVLDYFAGNHDRVPRELWMTLETLRMNKGKDLYVELLYALTHKYYPPKDAKKFWDTIVTHKGKISAKIGRDVGMKVAVLDYLDNEADKGQIGRAHV